MIALWIVGILIIIYAVRLIIKALRKYTKSAPVRKEKVENARTLGEVLKQQRASKNKNNPEEFHWHDEYATLNFFRFICKNIGNLGNGEIRK